MSIFVCTESSISTTTHIPTYKCDENSICDEFSLYVLNLYVYLSSDRKETQKHFCNFVKMPWVVVTLYVFSLCVCVLIISHNSIKPCGNFDLIAWCMTYINKLVLNGNSIK